MLLDMFKSILVRPFERTSGFCQGACFYVPIIAGWPITAMLFGESYEFRRRILRILAKDLRLLDFSTGSKDAIAGY
jgi:hypothetical protein